jgi:hypothetical protein
MSKKVEDKTEIATKAENDTEKKSSVVIEKKTTRSATAELEKQKKGSKKDNKSKKRSDKDSDESSKDQTPPAPKKRRSEVPPLKTKGEFKDKRGYFIDVDGITYYKMAPRQVYFNNRISSLGTNDLDCFWYTLPAKSNKSPTASSEISVVLDLVDSQELKGASVTSTTVSDKIRHTTPVEVVDSSTSFSDSYKKNARTGWVLLRFKDSVSEFLKESYSKGSKGIFGRGHNTTKKSKSETVDTSSSCTSTNTTTTAAVPTTDTQKKEEATAETTKKPEDK